MYVLVAFFDLLMQLNSYSISIKLLNHDRHAQRDLICASVIRSAGPFLYGNMTGQIETSSVQGQNRVKGQFSDLQCQLN